MLLKLDHIQLAMPESAEEEARAFYAHPLGLKEVEKPEALKARGGVWFELNGFGIHLGVEKDFRAAKKAHPAFCVADLDALFARLEQAGIMLAWDNSLADVRRFYAYDPFGNRLEFLTADGL